MNETERHLDQDRSTRRAARGLFDQRLAQVKADYAARGIGGRIKAKAVDESAKALDHTIQVASESKGIIAGTGAALMLWFFRGPILNAAKGLLGSGQDQVQDDPDSAANIDQE